jgi:hypothetical protein
MVSPVVAWAKALAMLWQGLVTVRQSLTLRAAALVAAWLAEVEPSWTLT